MKVECIKEKIKDAVALAEKITGKNLSLPVLSSILLLAKDKTLKIRATNLDLGIEIEIPAKVGKEGVVAVPGGILNNFLSNIQEKTVTLTMDNDNIIAEARNARAVIKSLPYEDFPTLPTIAQKKESFEISAGKIVSGLRSVWYSAATGDIKPEIASVFVASDAGDIVFVATDSFRLAEKKIDFIASKTISPLIIPLRNIADIIRVFDTVSGDVLVSFNASQISFEYEGLYLTSRLIDGIFPDYKQIMPKGFLTEAVVLKQDLANALKSMNVFSGKFNQVTISAHPANKKLEFRSKSPDVGESSITLDAALRGEAITLHFNHKYIFDCLQSIPKDSVSLHFNGESKPM